MSRKRENNCILETFKALEKMRENKSLEEQSEINSYIEERDSLTKRIWQTKYNREDNMRVHGMLLENAKTNYLSTALKGIYIEALNPYSLTDHGIALAEQMVDSYIEQSGGATGVFRNTSGHTYLMDYIQKAVTEAAIKEVKDIESILKVKVNESSSILDWFNEADDEEEKEKENKDNDESNNTDTSGDNGSEESEGEERSDIDKELDSDGSDEESSSGDTEFGDVEDGDSSDSNDTSDSSEEDTDTNSEDGSEGGDTEDAGEEEGEGVEDDGEDDSSTDAENLGDPDQFDDDDEEDDEVVEDSEDDDTENMDEIPDADDKAKGLDDVDKPKDIEGNEKFLDDLDKEEDVQKAVETIRDRVANAEEEFIKQNAEDKKKMDDILSKISNSVKTVEDLNDKNEKDDKEKAQEEIAKESVHRYGREMHRITESSRPHSIMESMARNLVASITKNQAIRETYTTEEGKISIDDIMESVKIMYGWLETVNTLQLEEVSPDYLLDILNNMD